MRGAAVALVAVLVGAAHAPFLPSSLEDIDSVNFALGVREFDVAAHRPHPPGYPVYIALGKATVPAVAALADPGTRAALDARALAAVSLVFAVIAVPLLYRLFACLSPPPGEGLAPPWRTFHAPAFAAAAVTTASPLAWYMSVRPMSDVPGLAAALASQVCLALAWWRQRPDASGDRRLSPEATAASGRMIVLGAFLAAIAIGVRSQPMWLTLPLLALVLVDRIGRGVAGALLGSGLTFGLGALAWAVPLIAASGGWNAYLAALGSQAGEDFAGVEMLYLQPSPRLAAFALVRTFIHPWDSVWLGGVMIGLAAIGAAALLWRDRRTAVFVVAMAAPYLLFHLLFQDTTFTRYALPLVPVVAWLAVSALALAGPRVMAAGAAAVVVWSLALAWPASVAYAARPSPVVRALAEMHEAATAGAPGALAMHQTFRRPLDAQDVRIEPRLPSPPRREWLELAAYWKSGATAPLWMLADPHRSDLALVDPRSREDRTRYAWDVDSLSALGGMRPADVVWYRMPPPGWFAEEGWALTPETAGMARLMGRGPHLGPITAWIRRRATAAHLVIGGRHLGAPSESPAAFSLDLDGQTVDTWTAAPGFFLRHVDLPAGALAGDGPLARLEVRSRAERPAPTSVEQFDLQDAGRLIWGYGEGWHEAEYSPALGVWRWASREATLRVFGAPGPVVLRLTAESSRRYFDTAARVRVLVGGRELAAYDADGGDGPDVRIPAEALAAAGGRIVIATDRAFVPAERGGPPDQRALALRVFAVALAPESSGLR
ncbi:MAG: DUF2723 domain-containing protein [Acidobacteriota bacterium]